VVTRLVSGPCLNKLIAWRVYVYGTPSELTKKGHVGNVDYCLINSGRKKKLIDQANVSPKGLGGRGPVYWKIKLCVPRTLNLSLAASTVNFITAVSRTRVAGRADSMNYRKII